MKHKNSPWNTMITRSERKKQEQIKNSNQHKNLENLGQNKPFEPPIKRSRDRPRKNYVLTDFKNISSKRKKKKR